MLCANSIDTQPSQLKLAASGDRLCGKARGEPQGSLVVFIESWPRVNCRNEM